MTEYRSPLRTVRAFHLALTLGGFTAAGPALSAQAAQWQLTRVSRLRVPAEISRVRTPSLLPDGRFLILDARAPFLHVLSRDGRIVRSFVAAGGGPGRASNPIGAGVFAGQIWLWDSGNGRMTYFDFEGSARREFPLRFNGSIVPLGPNRFMTAPFVGFGPSPASRPRTVLGIVDSTGAPRGQVVAFDDPAPQIEIRRSNGAMSVGGQPYMRAAVKIYYPYGNGVVIAFPQVEVRAGTTSFRLIRADQDGKPQFDGWVPIPGIPLTEEHITAAVKFYTTSEDANDAGFASRVRAAIQRPKFLPAFSVGLTGLRGEVWLREFTLGREGGRWFVVSAAGTIVGRVTMPAGEQLISILPDGGVLASGEDADGEPTLTRYQVVR
jgi:hypothetical protein